MSGYLPFVLITMGLQKYELALNAPSIYSTQKQLEKAKFTPVCYAE